jgi:spore coat polysaccharide biosynthesis protein SpsF
MKTVVLVTARLKSSRLPRKVLKPLAGRPMLCHLLDRMKQITGVQTVMICTSDLPEDNPLRELAEHESVACFRGHPEDVLKRLTDAAQMLQAHTVISCTADNPLTDPGFAQALLNYHLQNKNDYSYTPHLPLGTAVNILSYAAMQKICLEKDSEQTEIWGNYFMQSRFFHTGCFEVNDPLFHRPDIRLTVDTPEDFALMEQIFSALYQPGDLFDLKQVMPFLKNHPDLLELNNHVAQRVGDPIRLKMQKDN